MKKTPLLLSFLLLLCVGALDAQVPGLVNYQGRVTVGTTNFNGSGSFKFALVDNGVGVQATGTAVRQSAPPPRAVLSSL